MRRRQIEHERYMQSQLSPFGVKGSDSIDMEEEALDRFSAKAYQEEVGVTPTWRKGWPKGKPRGPRKLKAE